MSKELRDQYVGNLVPEGAEKQPTPAEWGEGVQLFSLGTIMFMANFADVVTEVWDEAAGDSDLDIDNIGLEPSED